VSRGVVAGGHPATAEAGAWALREGGNAVDGAIAAVLASVVTESPLTGLGAGGFMLVHKPGGDATLLDFFVSAGGLDGRERGIELEPVVIDFGDTTQVFNIGPASCGVPGVPSGLATAAERFGSMPLADLVVPAVGLARDGFEITAQHAYLFEILAPILAREPAGAAVYAPAGRMLGHGERIFFAELAETLERLGDDGPEPFYRGDIAAAIAATVIERGGTVAGADLAGYETIDREPVRARFGGCEILTNPPPSSGGILIAYALEMLTRIGRTDPESGVEVTELGVKDVILPGEIRDLVNKVVEAERVAKANLIRRQEETAATRSLLNTARLMEENPLLLRLKELESLERLVEKVGRIDLHAGDGQGFDALLNKLVRLKPADAA